MGTLLSNQYNFVAISSTYKNIVDKPHRYSVATISSNYTNICYSEKLFYKISVGQMKKASDVSEGGFYNSL